MQFIHKMIIGDNSAVCVIAHEYGWQIHDKSCAHFERKYRIEKQKTTQMEWHWKNPTHQLMSPRREQQQQQQQQKQNYQRLIDFIARARMYDTNIQLKTSCNNRLTICNPIVYQVHYGPVYNSILFLLHWAQHSHTIAALSYCRYIHIHYNMNSHLHGTRPVRFVKLF